MTNYIDPMDSAVEEAERPFTMFGQLETSASFVMFVNSKKVAWIEGQDNPRDRRTEVTMIINPIEESGLVNLSTKNVICSNNNEWATIVWPSLRDECKVANLREADRKWFKVETVKTGKTFVSKKTGETVANTTFKFVAMFNTHAECAAAYLADGNSIRTDATKGTLNGGAHSTMDDAAAIDMTPNDERRQTALAFLPALVNAAKKDKTVLSSTFASMPMISEFFTVNSPEVVALLNA